MTDGTPVALPFAQRPRRLQVAGRLRTGVKGNRGPQAIDTWRITSHDRGALDQLAEMYGGTVQPWRDAPTVGQWELFTEATTLNVVLPPDPLGDGPVYELWSGKGRQRRCDATTCETFRSGPDGPEPVEMPCICNAKGNLECKPKTRLQVMLPGIRFSGVWRYDSGSGNVADELAGMVYEVLGGHPRGFIEAELCLENRRSGTNKYTIPVLRIATSLESLAAGEVPVLGTGTPAPAPLAIEAAVVEDHSPGPGRVALVEALAEDIELEEMGAPHAERHRAAEMNGHPNVAPAGSAPAAPKATLGRRPADGSAPVDEALQDAYVRTARKLPMVLGKPGADAFKEWRIAAGFPQIPRTVDELTALVVEIRRRYLEAKGGPRPWKPSELTEVRRLLDELKGQPREWTDFVEVAFENFANADAPESWTDEQLTAFSTWIRFGSAPLSSPSEGSPHDPDREPAAV